MGLKIYGYNQIDDATLSAYAGDPFHASYPITNLQTRYLFERARTTTERLVCDIDLGANPVTVDFLAVAGTNMLATATLTVVVSNSASFSPAVATYTASASAAGQDLFVEMPLNARYYRVVLNDVGHAPEVGRIFIGKELELEGGIEWGASLQIESATSVLQALGGSEFFDVAPSRRKFAAKWSHLSTIDAFGEIYRAMKGHGVSGEYYVRTESDDTTYVAERSFLCRMRTLDPIANPYVGHHEVGLEFVEII